MTFEILEVSFIMSLMGLAVTLTFDPVISKSNQFIFVPNCMSLSCKFWEIITSGPEPRISCLQTFGI